MAGTTSDSGVGKSLEGTSSGEALSEWRSSEQMENVIASTSAPYWDADDEEDPGQNPSDMYGHHTWKIDNFSQINKRELRSSAFEVGSYKWYILIYPQGCDVCNHLSVFLCVANHDKLHPGWSHFAQFTIAVVNKDPKKSKYSDTLHRFRKKEHDWGWKKFMELSKVLEGFVTDDQLTIKAQVQVIREKPDRPFRCLDSYYRKVLLGVYLSNVEQICLRFVEEKLNKLMQLREDKARWSSFRAFWIAIDQNTRQEMCREKADTILRAIVKQFFIDKEVTSTLVMDSLYSGLRALEDQSKGKIGNKDILVAGEQIVPIMHMEDDMFVLVDDVLKLFEKVSMEPLPPKGAKGSQSRMKEDGWLEDCSKEFNELNERRLTEIGRRTIEIFVLAHIFGKIEVAYQEDVSLKRQEELIREEAVWLAQTEQRSKRGASEKGKKLKKKQAKQKRNYRKGKDKGKTEKSSAAIEDDPQPDISSDDEEEQILDVAECLLNNFKPEKFVDVPDLASCLPELPSPGSEEREASCDASSSCISGHSGVQRETWKKNKLYLVDDSSSTCSTDSVPSIVTNVLYGGFSLPKPRNRKSVNRIKNQRGSATVNGFGYHGEAYNRQPEATSESSKLIGAGGSAKAESQSRVASLSLNSKKIDDHHMTKKEKVVSLERESSIKGQAIEEKAFKEKIKLLPSKIMSSTVPVQPESKTSGPANLIVIDKPSSERATSVINTADTTNAVKKEPHKIVPNIPTNKPLAHPLPVVSRPLSAPIIPGPKTFAPNVSHVQTPPVLSRSASAASYVPISYRNAIMGITESHSQSSSPNPSQTHTQLSNYPSSSCNPSQSHRLVSLSPNSEFNPSQTRKSVPHSPSSQTQVSLSPSSAFNPSQSHTQVSLSPNSQPYQPQSQTRMSPSQSSPFNPSQWHTQVCPSPCPTEYPSQSHTQISYSPIYSLDSSNLHTQTPNSISASMSSPLSTERIKPVSLVNKNEKVNILDLVNTSQTSGLGDDFPHLDIINNLLDDELYIESLHSMTRRDSQPLSFPIDITGMSPEFVANSISSSRFEQDYNDDGYQLGYGSLVGNFDDMIPQINPGLYTNEPIDGLIPSQLPTNGSDVSYWTNWEVDNYPYNFLQNANLAYRVIDYTTFEPSNAH